MISFYDVYVLKLDKGTSFSEVERILQNVQKGTYIAIHECDGEEEEKLEFYRVLTSARRYVWVDEKDSPIRIDVMHISQNEYVFVVSVAHVGRYVSATEEALKQLFTWVEIVPFSLHLNEREGFVTTTSYWRNLLRKVPEFMTEVYNPKAVKLTAEIFALNPEVKELIEAASKKEAFNLKATFIATWTIIISKYLKSKSFLVEDQHDGGLLSRIPIYVDTGRRFVDIYASVVQQLKDSELYDMMPYDKFISCAGYDLSRHTVLTVNYLEQRKYDYFFENMRSGICYKLEAYKQYDSPFNVTFIVSDDEMFVKYDYNRDIFKYADIPSLHDSFCLLIKEIFTKTKNVTADSVAGTPVSQVSVEERIGSTKFNLLKKCELFSCLTYSELQALSIDSELVNFLMEDTVAQEGEIADYIYFIGEGMVTVYISGNDRILHPLMLLNSGSVFGIEGLTNEKLKTTYKVQSDIGKIVAIPKNKFLTLCEKKPNILLKLLRIQSDNVAKFEKLWIMN